MASLSVCEPLLPHRDGTAVTGQELHDIVTGQQTPLFVRETNVSNHLWSNVTLADFGRIFGNKAPMRLLVGPAGVVGYYHPNRVEVQVHDQQVVGRLRTPDGTLPEAFPLTHLQTDGDVASMISKWRWKRSGNFFVSPHEHCYFRTISNALRSARVGASMPTAIAENRRILGQVNAFISQADTATNLHFDRESGVIHQVKGRKRVLLFPPTQKEQFDCYPPEHFLARRSRFDMKLTEQVFQAPRLAGVRGYECTLQPGDWVYIPADWLHYVETLDDDTISLITRFKR